MLFDLLREIYTPRPRRLSWTEWLSRMVRTFLRLLVVLLAAGLATVPILTLWYYGFHLNNLYVESSMREVFTDAVIPTLGLLYSLLTATIVAKVFNEYMQMRMAVKRGDVAEYMQLADEELSPLLHFTVAALAVIILVCFMLLGYPDFFHGAVVIGSVTFIFAMLCYVVVEIDDPCHGLWVIRSIPPQWRTCDPKKYRQTRYKFDLDIQLNDDGVQITAMPTSSPTQPRL